MPGRVKTVDTARLDIAQAELSRTQVCLAMHVTRLDPRFPTPKKRNLRRLKMQKNWLVLQHELN